MAARFSASIASRLLLMMATSSLGRAPWAGNYVVYHSEPLSGIWLPLSGTLAGTGGELSFTDPEDGLTERFYRIGVTLP